MKKTLFVLALAAVLMVGTAAVAFAAGPYGSPAEIVSALTGRTADEVLADRGNGLGFGTQAANAGVLEDFQDERLALYRELLDQAVADGRLTLEEADALYAAMEQRFADCTGDCDGDCTQDCIQDHAGIGAGGLGAGNGVCGMEDGRAAGIGGRWGRGMNGTGN